MKKTFSAHFLPSREKKRRARLLAHEALFCYLSALLLLFGALRFVPKGLPGILGYASRISVSDLLNYTNRERRAHGLKEVKLNNALNAGAAKKASDMFKNNYWAHVSPSGKQPWDFFVSSGYDYQYAGENLAKNFNDSSSVVKAWMNSPSHRENMLNPNYTEIGFAVVNGKLQGYETTLVVQFFGAPRYVASAKSEVGGAQNTAQAETKELVKALEPVPVTVEKTPVVAAMPSVPVIKTDTGFSFDVYAIVKALTISMGIFLLGLFGLDIWYSSYRGVVKLNGSTLAHMFLLILAVMGMGLTMIPGRVG